MPNPWVAIQRNPTSGLGSQDREILLLCTRLRKLGLRPRLFSRRERMDERFNRPAGREGLVCLVAAGGDGTIADLVNRFPGLPLAILPLGTENLMARYWGIPRDGEAVAEMIANGVTRRIDVGLVNGRRFTLMMSAGFDADVVHRTHGRRTGNISKWNYLQPILDSLRTYRYPELRLEVEEGEGAAPRRMAGRMLILTNVPAYALGLTVAPDAACDDGLLDLRLFERPAGFQMLRYLYKVARRQHEGLPDVRIGRVRRLKITSDEPVPIQCDGDAAGFTPAEVSVLSGALSVVVPHRPGEVVSGGPGRPQQ